MIIFRLGVGGGSKIPPSAVPLRLCILVFQASFAEFGGMGFQVEWNTQFKVIRDFVFRVLGNLLKDE